MLNEGKIQFSEETRAGLYTELWEQVLKKPAKRINTIKEICEKFAFDQAPAEYAKLLRVHFEETRDRTFKAELMGLKEKYPENKMLRYHVEMACRDKAKSIKEIPYFQTELPLDAFPENDPLLAGNEQWQLLQIVKCRKKQIERGNEPESLPEPRRTTQQISEARYKKIYEAYDEIPEIPRPQKTKMFDIARAICDGDFAPFKSLDDDMQRSFILFLFSFELTDKEQCSFQNLFLECMKENTSIFSQELNEVLQQKEVCYKDIPTCKILLLGDIGTGKTSFIRRSVHNQFNSQYKATIGVDFVLKKINVEKDFVAHIQFWDLAGQERFGNMTKRYYKEASAAFVFIDMSRHNSFDGMKKWVEDLNKKIKLPDGSLLPKMLIVTKIDLDSPLTKEECQVLQTFCKDFGFVGFVPVSAKDGVGFKRVEEMFINNIFVPHLDNIVKGCASKKESDMLSLVSQTVLSFLRNGVKHNADNGFFDLAFEFLNIDGMEYYFSDTYKKIIMKIRCRDKIWEQLIRSPEFRKEYLEQLAEFISLEEDPDFYAKYLRADVEENHNQYSRKNLKALRENDRIEVRYHAAMAFRDRKVPLAQLPFFKFLPVTQAPPQYDDLFSEEENQQLTAMRSSA